MKDLTILLEILTAERNYGEVKMLYKKKNSWLMKTGIPKILSTIFITNLISLSPRVVLELLLMILESEKE